MNTSVFDHQDFRQYLVETLGDKTKRSGLKSKAATAIEVHTTLISQFLSGQATPSLEQADKLNRFFGHNEEESHYFLLLVQKARAGTASLKRYFQAQLDQLTKQRKVMKRRVGSAGEIEMEDELKYYSAWQFAAVHVALSIPELTEPEALSKVLNIPLERIRTILEFLLRTGLAVRKERSYAIGHNHIHLGSDSPHVRNHHINWRVRAIQALDVDPHAKSGLHYSSAVTLSRNDVEKIKELLIQNVGAMNKVILHSKEEAIYGLNFDFFDLSTS